MLLYHRTMQIICKAVSTKMAVIRVASPCILVDESLISLIKEAERTYETLVKFYQNIRRYNPEHRHLFVNYGTTLDCVSVTWNKARSETSKISQCRWNLSLQWTHANLQNTQEPMWRLPYGRAHKGEVADTTSTSRMGEDGDKAQRGQG